MFVFGTLPKNVLKYMIETYVDEENCNNKVNKKIKTNPTKSEDKVRNEDVDQVERIFVKTGIFCLRKMTSLYGKLWKGSNVFRIKQNYRGMSYEDSPFRCVM